MADRVSEPEALIYAMVTTSAADREITSDEILRMTSIVRELPAFQKFKPEWFADVAQTCGRHLAKAGGVERVIGIIKESLPPHLRETAYVLAAEVALSDVVEHPDEEKFIAMLALALGLDKLTCAALERAAGARHRRV